MSRGEGIQLMYLELEKLERRTENGKEKISNNSSVLVRKNCWYFFLQVIVHKRR
jgi:hypothetical protein